MKELKLKIKRGHYNLFKELTDKQAGELVKGMCAYMYDGKPFFTKDAYLKGVFMSIHHNVVRIVSMRKRIGKNVRRSAGIFKR